MNFEGVNLDEMDLSNSMPDLMSKNVSIKEIVTENIKQQYKFGKILGEGAFGKVKKATLLADPTKVFAIKSIPRHLMDKDHKNGSDLPQSEKESMANLLN